MMISHELHVMYMRLNECLCLFMSTLFIKSVDSLHLTNDRLSGRFDCINNHKQIKNKEDYMKFYCPLQLFLLEKKKAKHSILVLLIRNPFARVLLFFHC